MSTYKKRQCLKCNNLFSSRSAGRRVCNGCNRINNKIYLPSISILATNDRTRNGKTIPSTKK